MKKNSRTVIIVYFLMAVLGIYISSYQAVLMDLMEEFSLSVASSGGLISAHFIGSLIFPIVFGGIADKQGKRKTIILASLLFFISVLLFVFTRVLGIIIVSIFISGGALSMIEAIASAILCEDKKNGTKLMSLSQTLFCLGCVAGPLLSRAITDTFRSVKVVYVFIAALAFLQLVLSMFIKIESRECSCRPAKSIVKLFKNRTFIAAAFIILMYVGIEEGCAFWISGYIGVISTNNWLKAFCLGFYWLGMGIGRFIVGTFGKSSIKSIFIGITISFVSLGIILFANIRDELMIVMLFALIGFGFAALWPILFARAVLLEHSSSASAGFLMSSSSLGSGILPFIMGVAANNGNMRAAFAIILVTIVFIMILLLRFKNLCKKV